MRRAIVGIALLLVLGFVATSTSLVQFHSSVGPHLLENGAPLLSKDYISALLTIDGIYPSMTGPLLLFSQ